MAIPQSIPVRFTPRGLADAFDATDMFPGACRKLTNLIFDQSNPEIVVARPGVGSGVTNFGPFVSPGFISIQVTIGNRIYGMIATGRTPGYDEPFCYDIGTSSFIGITGVTSGNSEGRPASPAESGEWVPPTIAVVGVSILITHPGYTGSSSSFFGVIDITNPMAPAYSTTNTTTNLLPTAPTGVANYNNRAWFVCGNQAFYTDVLAPTVMTNAGQSLTVGDSAKVNAISGLPTQTTSAGIISGLLMFKNSQIWQVIGDAAITGSLTMSYLSLNIGTTMPRSVVSTPLGVFFGGPDAAYVVGPTGSVIPLTSQMSAVGSTPDIRQPFGFVTEPTRAAASFTANVYRICLPTIIDGNVGVYDYWFDFRKMRWNGPHTFNYDCASPAGSYFILSGAGSGSKLFRSEVFGTTNTTYLDNGSIYYATLRMSELPKKDEMSMKQVVESTVELAASTAYSITAFDENDVNLASASITPSSLGVKWGDNVWGDRTKWRSSKSPPRTYTIDWPVPLVFNKLAVELSITVDSSVAIGTFYCRMQKAGYTLQPPAPAPAPKRKVMMAVASVVAPYTSLYSWSYLGFGAEFPNPPVPPENAPYLISTSTIGNTVVMALNDAPFVAAYSVGVNGLETRLAGPVPALSSNIKSLVFSPSGDVLAIVVFGSPEVIFYKWSATGFGSRLPDLTTGAAVVTMSFTPANDALILTTEVYPYVQAYSWSSLGIGTRFADPSPPIQSDIGGANVRLAISPRGEGVVFSIVDPFIALLSYYWSSSGFGAQYGGVLMPSAAREVSFSPSGTEIVSICNTYPYVYSFPWLAPFDGFYGTLSPPIDPIPTIPTSVTFSPSSNSIAFAFGSAPYVAAYQWGPIGFGTKYSDPVPPLTSWTLDVKFV